MECTSNGSESNLEGGLVRGGRSLFLCFLSVSGTTQGAELDLEQCQAAMHVHSTFSNGEYDILELAQLAVERNIDVLVLTDSFLTTVTYGIWPFDRIGFEGINQMVRPGVGDHGVENYLAAVQRANEQFPELLVIPGVEVTPYYYWKGAPWSELTLHNFDFHLLVLGLTGQEIKNLPLIENETWDNTPREGSLLVAPLVLFLLGVTLLFVKRTRKVRLTHYTVARRQRFWGWALIPLLFSLLLAWNNYPFGKLSDPYSGEHDTRPYQRVIDYVGEKGGVIYWSYPEARFSDVQAGGARMISRAHPEDLLSTDGYHGFEGIYGDRIRVTRPGETWDLALLEYLEGSRKNPPFVTTGIDFHYLKEGGWFELDGGQTLLLMKSFTLSSFIIPVIIFGVPIFDSTLAVTRRYLRQRGFTKPDKEHLHHRLLDLGLNQKQTVLLLYFVTVLLGIIAFAFTVQLNEYAAVVIVLIGLLGGLLAKELQLFGTEPEKMDRQYAHEQKQKSLFDEEPFIG